MAWWSDANGNDIQSGSPGDPVYDINGNYVGVFDNDGESVVDEYGVPIGWVQSND